MGRSSGERMRRGKRFADLGVNLVVLVSASLVGVLFAELGLRLWMGLRDQANPSAWEHLMRFSPSLGVEHKTNVDFTIAVAEHGGGEICLRTNNQGLRQDDETSYRKPVGCRRILILGDSHVDGMVDNSEFCTARLAGFLNGTQGGTSSEFFEVLNAGVASYGPLQEYLWLRQYGVYYHPDLVILVFYVGNDIVNLLREDIPYLEEIPEGGFALTGYPIVASRPQSDGGGGVFLSAKRFLERHLVSYRLSQDWVKRSPLNGFVHTLGIARRGEKTRTAQARAQATSPGAVLQSLLQAHVAKTRPEDIECAFRKCRAILSWFLAETEKIDAVCILVLLPSKQQFEGEDDEARTREAAGILILEEADLQFDEVVLSRVRSMADSLGVSVLDPLSEFRKYRATCREALYYRFDWHLNPAGHRLLAEVLGRYVRETVLPARDAEVKCAGVTEPAEIAMGSGERVRRLRREPK